MDEPIEYIRRIINESAFVLNFNADDVRLAKSQEWWIKDFLAAEKNAEAAAELFVACLRWRETFGVQGIGTLELSDALAENFIYFHGCDLEGRNILWLNWSRYQFITTRRAAERLLIYWIERHTMETRGAPFTFNVNFHSCGNRDIDLDFAEFIFTCLNEYYPGCVEQILLYEVSASMWNRWQDFANVKQRAFCSFHMANVDRASIGIYIPFKYLPSCMGGEDDFVFVMNSLPNCIYSRLHKKLDGESDAFKSLSDDFAAMGVNFRKTVTFKGDSDSMKNDAILSNSAQQPLTSKSTDGVTDSIIDARGDDSSEVFLGVSESDSLMLKRSPEKSDYVAQLTLENRSRNGCQLFKVKTTAPQKFRVHPTLGMIAAGQRQTICIVLDKAYEKSYRTERFLVSTVLISSPSSLGSEALQDFANIFAQSKPEETFKIKLNCTMQKDENSAVGDEKPLEDGALASGLNNIGQSIDRDLALFLAERELYDSESDSESSVGVD